MNQQFKLKKAGYYKDLKQMFLKGLFFILSFIAILFGVLYLTGFNFQKLFTIGVALIVWIQLSFERNRITNTVYLKQL